MELDDIFSTRGSETERSSPGAILSQLKSKLKSQSTQIRLLESYKSLCEQRILDLYPSHPLPIQQDHLGQYLYSETLPLKQKISKLEQKISQYCDPYLIPSPHLNSVSQKSLIQQFATLQREKKELEESLRNEVQLNEEQRSYIEVLKQAVEVNIEKLGLEGLTIEDFTGFIRLRSVIDEKNKELMRVGKTVKDLECQVIALKEVIIIKNNENLELVRVWGDVNEKLGKKVKKVKLLKEDSEKLEEEKSRLIEYIDNKLANENRAEELVRQLEKKIEFSENEVLRFKERINVAEIENRKVNERVRVKSEEYEKCEKELKEAQKIFLVMKMKVDEEKKVAEVLAQEAEKWKTESLELNDEIKSVLKDKSGVLIELDQVKSELKVKAEEFEVIIQENRGVCEELQMLKEELEKRTCKTSELIKEIDEKIKQSSELKSSINKLQTENQKLTEELTKKSNKSQSELMSLQEINRKLEENVENLNRLLKESQTSENQLKEQNKVLKIKLETLTEHSSHSSAPSSIDLSFLETEFYNLNDKISLSNTMRSENQELSNSLKILSESLNLLQINFNALQSTQNQIFESLKTLYSHFQSPLPDPYTPLSLISLIHQRIQQDQNEKSHLEQELKTLHNTNTQYINTLNKYDQELSSSKSETLLQKSKIDKQNLEISYLSESIKTQVTTLQGEIFVLRQSIKESNEENEKILDSNRKMQLELNQCKYKMSSNEVTIQSHEEKSALLQNEKTQLANLLKKLQSTLNSSQLQQILNETFRIHSELEYCSLEKLRISMQLRKTAPSDPEYSALSQQLSQCTQTITKHLSKLNKLETELEKPSY